MQNNFIKNRAISLPCQKINLYKSFPDSKCYIVRNKLVWKAKVSPSPLSRIYNAELYYTIHDRPKMYIVGNELQKLDDVNFPHKYKIDKENKRVLLCLYRYNEFSNCKLLSNTIIPWTIEWLYHYEIWLTTGNWLGGGEHI